MPRTPDDTPDYQISPRVVPEGWKGKLRLTGDYAHARLIPGVKYAYALASMRWFADTKRGREPVTGEVKADAKGRLTIPFAPDAPGEWTLTVTSEDRQIRTLPELGLFVVDPALRKLRPYIGDLHTHSTGSDGRQEPAYCAIRARKLGFDFLALTDHNNYASSGEMIRQVRRKLGRTMLLMRGEELHASPAPFHYVGVGHRSSIEDIRARRPKQHQRGVAAIVKELRGRETVPRLDLAPYAEGLWKIRKAKELGGLVLFAHPYWSYRNTLCIDEAEREQAFLDREFDAVETATEADRSSFMPNRVLAEAVRDGALSVVGISDAHNFGPDGWIGNYWTYVLAEELSQEAVFEAIRARRSLSCQNVEGRLVLNGPFELIDFADFYLRKLWPIRRRTMQIEAQLAFSSLRGGAYSRDVVEKLDRELAQLDRRLWA